jgi:hypothetical protein
MNNYFCDWCENQVMQVNRLQYHHPNGEVYSMNTCPECRTKNKEWELSWAR